MNILIKEPFTYIYIFNINIKREDFTLYQLFSRTSFGNFDKGFWFKRTFILLFVKKINRHILKLKCSPCCIPLYLFLSSQVTVYIHICQKCHHFASCDLYLSVRCSQQWHNASVAIQFLNPVKSQIYTTAFE